MSNKENIISLAIMAIIIVVLVGVGLTVLAEADQPEMITPAPVEVEVLPSGFIQRPIAPYVYQYLADNYAAFDKGVIILVATFDDWCYGVTCEHWIVKPHFTHPPLMLRCYPSFENQCAPTYEAEYIRPAPGQQPTPTGYTGVPES